MKLDPNTDVDGITNKMGDSVNSFLHRATSIPLITDIIAYVNSKYSHVKGINENVASLLNGTERGLKKIMGTAFNLSEKVVPYEYLNKLAFRSLDKIEASFPIIRTTTKQIHFSFKSYKTKYSEKASSLTNRTLNKFDDMIDYALPAEDGGFYTETAEKGGVDRVVCIFSKIKTRFLKTAKHVAQLKGETVMDTQTLSAKDMVNVLEHWLLNSYKRLQIKPIKEGILMKAVRLSTLTAVGTTLNAIRALEATLPTVKQEAGMMVMKFKAAVYATFKLLVHRSTGTYANARQKVTLVIGTFKKLEKNALARLLPIRSTLKVTGFVTLSEEELCTKLCNLEKRISLLEKIAEVVKEAETSNENTDLISDTNLY